MIQRLFVYGTLAPGKPNEHLLEEIGGSWQKASVRGTLIPEGWGATLGYPAIVLDKLGDAVDGFLFSSNKLSTQWTNLDEFEGECYERVLTTAILSDKSTVEAYVYTLKRK